ncbi:MAG: hypothetical protein ACOCXA_07935 [Planctomycetota bacterium]
MSTHIARRISPAFPIGLALLLIVAVVLTIRLGNPLGRATGIDRFTHSVQCDRLTLASTEAHPHLDHIAEWAATYVRAISTELGIPEVPVTVRLLINKRSFVHYGSDHILGFNRNMDFCYYPSDRCVYGYFMRIYDLRPRLQHELLHAVLHASRSRLPLWFEEGLAELSEDFEFDHNGVRLEGIQRRRMQLARRHAARDTLPDPTQLGQLGPRRFYGRDATLNYSAAYSLVLFLHQQQRLLYSLRSGSATLDQEQYKRFVIEPAAWDQPQPVQTATTDVDLAGPRRIWVVDTGVLGNASY